MKYCYLIAILLNFTAISAQINSDSVLISEDGKFLLMIDDPFYCLLYTSDAADERSSVDLGGRRIIKKKKKVAIDRLPTTIIQRKIYYNILQTMST